MDALEVEQKAGKMEETALEVNEMAAQVGETIQKVTDVGRPAWGSAVKVEPLWR